VKRSSLAKLAAICALLISASIAHAQKPWEVSLAAGSLNTYYDEESISMMYATPQYPMGLPQSLGGNSFTLLSLSPEVTYRARRQLGFPAFARVSATMPLITLSGLEAGHLRDSVNSLVQREDVKHSRRSVSVTIGYELLPFLQPFATYEWEKFASRRMNELDGTDTGTLEPYYDQDYTETVTASSLGFGFEGYFYVSENSDIRVRYRFGYAVPQSVSSINDIKFGDVDWSKTVLGEGTTGYMFSGQAQVDFPLPHDSYWSVGATLSKHYWNGDGREVHIPGQPRQWPINFAVEAGGFVKIGMFF
jgi:hypothetical protein